MATLHALPTAATPVERILSRFDRKQIEDFIEVAISLLDVADDPDVEDDDAAEDDDPRGGNVEDEGEETHIARILPRYGADQSLGPINTAETFGHHHHTSETCRPLVDTTL